MRRIMPVVVVVEKVRGMAAKPIPATSLFGLHAAFFPGAAPRMSHKAIRTHRHRGRSVIQVPWTACLLSSLKLVSAVSGDSRS